MEPEFFLAKKQIIVAMNAVKKAPKALAALQVPPALRVLGASTGATGPTGATGAAGIISEFAGANLRTNGTVVGGFANIPFDNVEEQMGITFDIVNSDFDLSSPRGVYLVTFGVQVSDNGAASWGIRVDGNILPASTGGQIAVGTVSESLVYVTFRS